MNTKIKSEERMRRIVQAIGKEVINRRGLIDALNLRQDARRNFRENYLKPAIAKGLVKMQFPEVPTSPEQAYRLTANGLDFLAEINAEE